MELWADLDYYENDYGGQEAISENDLLRGQAYVDKITFGRVSQPDAAVKNAVCAAAEVYFYSCGGLSAESKDGFHVERKEDAAAELYRASAVFLPAELLERGVEG